MLSVLWRGGCLLSKNDNNVIETVLSVAKRGRNVIDRATERKVISAVAARLNIQIRRIA
jgi:hypothetical protein